MNACQRFIIDRNNCLVLVIDIQEKLCGAMDTGVADRLRGNVSVLLDAASELEVPVITTEQYPSGLGSTLPLLLDKLSEEPMDKISFSCCRDDGIFSRINASGRRKIIVAGMEAHICVLQSVLDLLDKGYHVHVVSDAVMSRRKESWRRGLDMASAAGAVITTTETVLFQLLERAGTPEFRKLSKLIR
jgi:nicotinamidase-related amidase